LLITKRNTAVYNDEHTANGLQVCFIHCPDANKSALSVSIKAGHYHDPDNCPGLAHLFEHSLFSGSKNYANGNHLNELLSQNSGFLNAWTSAELTNFHFDCSPNVFLEACSVLLDMLTQPLFSEQGLAQEIEAIDAEFKMRIKDDIRRLYDVHKATCNPAHPFHRFTVGSKQIFEKFTSHQLAQMLRQRHTQVIHAARVKVTIVLPFLETEEYRYRIQSDLLGLLNQVPATNRQAQQMTHTALQTMPLYKHEHLRKLIHVKPVKTTRNAIITFALPAIEQWRDYKPLLMLSHLIEDLHEGGLASFLKQHQWITDITAGGGISGLSFQEFSINLKLTHEGARQLPTILAYLLQFCEQLHEALLEHWRICEKASQLALQALHSGAPPPVDEAVNVASRLHEMGLDDALKTDTLIDVEDQDSTSARVAFHSVTQLLSEDNMRVFLIDPEFNSSISTQQYSVPYLITPLLVKADLAKKTFTLPARNKYMPNLIADKVKRPASPLLQLVSGRTPLWSAFSPAFDASKGDIYISIEQASMLGSAHNAAIKKLWLSMTTQKLELQFGAAEFAGLHYRLYGHQAGLTLHIGGFAEKQFLLALEVIQQIQQQHCSVTIFEQAKNNLLNGLQNALLNKPINQLFFDLNCLLQNNTYSHQELSNALQLITLSEVCAQSALYFKNCFIETLCVGAHDNVDLYTFNERLSNLLPATTRQARNTKAVASLKQMRAYVGQSLPIEQSASLCYFQAPDKTTRSTVLMIFMEKLLSALLFDQLRNKRQLGYLVGCGYMPVNQHPGLAIYVQSGKYSSSDLSNIMLAELAKIIERTALTERRVASLKKTLMEQFAVSYTSHAQFAQKQWINLDSPHPSAEDERLQKGFAELTLSDINQALQDLISLDSVKMICLNKSSDIYQEDSRWVSQQTMKDFLHS